jgi:hypothetical protein
MMSRPPAGAERKNRTAAAPTASTAAARARASSGCSRIWADDHQAERALITLMLMFTPPKCSRAPVPGVSPGVAVRVDPRTAGSSRSGSRCRPDWFGRWPAKLRRPAQDGHRKSPGPRRSGCGRPSGPSPAVRFPRATRLSRVGSARLAAIVAAVVPVRGCGGGPAGLWPRRALPLSWKQAGR